MPDLNRTELMGCITFDPELRRIPSGTAVTELRMAVGRSYKKGDEWQKETLYIDVVVWGTQAEKCCDQLRKGSSVFIEGYLKMEQWNDKNTGEKRSKIKVQADKVHFLEGKRDGSSQSEQRHDENPQQQGRSQPQRGGYTEQPQQQGRGGAPQGRGGGYAGRGPTAPMTQYEADEDVPF